MSVQLTVHRGTQQIGGSCIEIEHRGGSRIILDCPSWERMTSRTRVAGRWWQKTFLRHNHSLGIGKATNCPEAVRFLIPFDAVHRHHNPRMDCRGEGPEIGG